MVNDMEQQYYVDIVSGLAERTIKRLWIVILLLIVLLVGSNVLWVVYENQFEEVVTTVEAQTDDGGTAIANTDGSVNYYGNGEGNG